MLNSSGLPQVESALAVIGHAMRRRRGRADVDADAACHFRDPGDGDAPVLAALFQEHHSRAGKWGNAQHRAQGIGWSLVGSEAVQCPSGKNSAGTAIAVPSHVGLSKVPGHAWDASPAASPGRLAVAWIDAVVPGGLLLLSLYLWHGEGLTPRNLRLLESAGAVIKRHGAAWTLGADANMSPDELLRDAGDWLDKIGGTVVAPDKPTYTNGNTSSLIDYFIVDKRLTPAVESVRIVDRFPSSPHKMIALRIRAAATRYVVRVARQPKAFPVEKPVGCSRKPPIADFAMARAAATSTAADSGALCAAWNHAFDIVEHDLCGTCDLVTSSGSPRADYCGRGKGERFRWKQVLPRRAEAVGATDAIGLGLMWFAARAAEIAGLMAKKRSGRSLAPAAVHQWEGIKKSFAAAAKGPLRALIKDSPTPWRLRAWRIAAWPVGADDFGMIGEWAAEAHRMAHARKARSVSDNCKAWWRWVDDQMRKGAGALHKLAKRDAPIFADAVDTPGGKSSSPQHIVDHDRADWQKIWHKHADVATAPWRRLPASAFEPPDAPSDDDMMRCARSFRRYTGTGVDGFKPHWYSWLSLETMRFVAQLFVATEKAGVWPHQLAAIFVHLIAKRTGGRRPIGILAGFVRWWEKVRKPLVLKWRTTVPRPYNWATKGRSSVGAVWRQSLYDEAAAASGQSSATLLLDLVKAFEMVQLRLVWEAGVRLGFPLVILRLVLESFSLARHLVYAGAFAEAVWTLSAVLAGGGFATDCLFLVLVQPIDDWLIAYPMASVCLFADDINAHIIGSHSVVAEVIVQGGRQLIHTLEDDLGLQVSRGTSWSTHGGKSVAVSSSQALDRKLKLPLRALGIDVKHTVRHLGVSYSAGKVKRRTEERARQMAAVAKMPKVRTFGKKAARHVVRTGIVPSFSHASRVHGSTDEEIKKLQRMYAGAGDTVLGRSLVVRLAVLGFDPGQELAIGPILEWAKAVWEASPDHDVLELAWRRALPTVGLAARPSTAALGPAGAMVAACRRLGWDVPAATVLRDRLGVLLDLTDICPRTVEKYLKRDYDHWLLSGSDLAAQLAGHHLSHHAAGHHPPPLHHAVDAHRQGLPQLPLEPAPAPLPLLDPISRFARSRDSRGPAKAARASVVAMVEGGWATQRDLYERCIADDPFCLACGKEVGDLRHQLCVCESLEPLIRGFGDADIVRIARSEPRNYLFVRGVPIVPPSVPPPQPKVFWALPQEEHGTYFTGVGFTDGALRHPNIRGAQRGGWAAVIVDCNGHLISGIWGPCPDPFPSSLRSELWGVIGILRLAVPPLLIYTDNQEVHDGINVRGEDWCTSAARDGADLWRITWHLLRDIGPGIMVRKVKAHLTHEDVQDGRISLALWRGNRLADKFAKAGAQHAEKISSPAALVSAHEKAARFYDWVAHVAQNWVQTAEVTHKRERPPKKTRRPRRPRPAHAERPHELWELRGRLCCVVCARRAVGKRPRRVLSSSACPGSVASRVAGLDADAGTRADIPRLSRLALARAGWSRVGADVSSARRDQRGGQHAAPHHLPRPLPELGDNVLHPVPPSIDHLSPALHQDHRGDHHSRHLEDVWDNEADLDPFGHLGDQMAENRGVRRCIVHEDVDERPPKRLCASSRADSASASSSTAAASADPGLSQAGGPQPMIIDVVPPQLERPSVGAGAGDRERFSNIDAGADDEPRSRHGGARHHGDGDPHVHEPRLTAAERLDRLRARVRARAAGGGGLSPPAAAQTVTVAARSPQSQPGDDRGVDLPQHEFGGAAHGQAAPRWGPGHDVYITGHVVWCKICGRYAIDRSIGIAASCQGPARGVYVSRLRRLRQGRHPLSGQPILS